MRRFAFLILGVALAACAGPRLEPTSPAQAVAPGRVIRLQLYRDAPYGGVLPLGGAHVGTVIGVGRDSLWFQARYVTSPASIPWTSIERVQMPVGRRSNWNRGLLAGLALGIVVAALEHAGSPDPTAAGAKAIGALVIWPSTGLLVGGLTHRTLWQTVPLDAIPR